VTDGPRLRVLAIDDEPYITATLRRAFRNDFVLVTETDPEAALGHLASSEFDVILADYSMPRMNGVAFLERAREIQPRAARYLVTAHASTGEVARAVTRGIARAVIAKPWTRRGLLDVVTAPALEVI
jgi:response regulator RpfG family c-di-GMP phosphodiesterase